MVTLYLCGIENYQIKAYGVIPVRRVLFMVDYGTFQQQVSKLIWGGGLRAKSRGGLMPYSSLFPALQPRHVVQLQEQLLLSCCGDIQQQAATLLWEELHYIYTVSSLLFFHSHTVIINTYFAICCLAIVHSFQVSTNPTVQRGG